jgi:hypothetical protein
MDENLYLRCILCYEQRFKPQAIVSWLNFCCVHLFMMLISSLVVLMVLTELKLQDSSRGYMHGSGKEGGGGRNGGGAASQFTHAATADTRWGGGLDQQHIWIATSLNQSSDHVPFCDSCLQKRRGKKLARRSRGSDRSRSIHGRHLSSPLLVVGSSTGERDKRIRIRRIIFRSNRRRLNGLVGTFAVGAVPWWKHRMHGPTCLAKTYVGHRIPRAYRIEKASVLWKTRRDEMDTRRTPSAAQSTAWLVGEWALCMCTCTAPHAYSPGGSDQMGSIYITCRDYYELYQFPARAANFWGYMYKPKTNTKLNFQSTYFPWSYHHFIWHIINTQSHALTAMNLLFIMLCLLFFKLYDW